MAPFAGCVGDICVAFTETAPSGAALSADNMQGVLGEFVLARDANNNSTNALRVDGVLGEFVPTIDATAL